MSVEHAVMLTLDNLAAEQRTLGSLGSLDPRFTESQRPTGHHKLDCHTASGSPGLSLGDPTTHWSTL